MHSVKFNKATQLSKKKNNTADALFVCDSSHIIEHVQNGLKMSIHSTTTGRPTIQSFAVWKGWKAGDGLIFRLGDNYP